MDLIVKFVAEFVATLCEMSPYLLIGFGIAGLLHVFVPRSLTQRYFHGSGVGASFRAALLGVPLPLCSCGVIPTSMAFYKNGASKGSTLSFLVSTPQTGVDSIIATYSMLGLPFAIMRPLLAFITGVAGGWIEGVVDKQEDNENKTVVDDDMSVDVSPRGFWRKLVEALRYGFIDFLGDISKWLVIGLLVAALITTLVPHDFMETMNLSPILQMLLIIVVAVPMYVCATGSIPVAAGLVAVGVDPGAAFVFLMAGPATNAATITILRKTLGQRALLVYLLSIVCGALVGGVVISYLLPTDWFAVASRGVCGECVVGDGIGLVPIVCGVIMAALVVWSFVFNKICGCHKSFDEAGCAPAEITAVFKVKNMTCSHCKANVESAAKSVAPGLFAEANVSESTLVVRGLSVETEKIVEAVSQMGYDISLLSQCDNSQSFKNSKQKHDER